MLKQKKEWDIVVRYYSSGIAGVDKVRCDKTKYDHMQQGTMTITELATGPTAVIKYKKSNKGHHVFQDVVTSDISFMKSNNCDIWDGIQFRMFSSEYPPLFADGSVQAMKSIDSCEPEFHGSGMTTRVITQVYTMDQPMDIRENICYEVSLEAAE